MPNKPVTPIIPPSAQTFWPELRAALRARGLSLADLARLSGRPYATLSKHQCGYGTPSDSLIRDLSRALGMNPEELRPRVRS